MIMTVMSIQSYNKVIIIIIIIIKHRGLIARRCLTPSSPNSSSSFCPLLLSSAPGGMPCLIMV